MTYRIKGTPQSGGHDMVIVASPRGFQLRFIDPLTGKIYGGGSDYRTLKLLFNSYTSTFGIRESDEIGAKAFFESPLAKELMLYDY